MPIKNIIFDLGGVVLNLDQDRTLRAFSKLGADLDELNSGSSIFTDFETGKVDADFFIHTLNSHLKGSATKEQIIQAWNMMLLDLPYHRVELIKALKKKYRVFLLSNTNSLHIESIYQTHGADVFDEMFEKVWLSHEIGLRKPHIDCYHHVLNDAGLKGSETVFVDDSRINIKGAKEAGLNTIWAKEPLDNWFVTELRKTDVLEMR